MRKPLCSGILLSEAGLPDPAKCIERGHGIYSVRIAAWHGDGRALRAVREAVFIREQSVPAELEWDEFDADCIHLIAVDAAENAIGTARLLQQGENGGIGGIGRMAVLKEWRGKGVGDALMRRLLKEAAAREIQQLTLNAQVYAAGFYARFGFMAMGNRFMEAGIPHVKMALQLASSPIDLLNGRAAAKSDETLGNPSGAAQD